MANFAGVPPSAHNKRNPLMSYDVVVRHGVEIPVPIFYNCITALPDYEKKSLEELRWEDYQLNRKFPLFPPNVPPPQTQPVMPRTSIMTVRNPGIPKLLGRNIYPSDNDGTGNKKYKKTFYTEINESTIPFKVVDANLTTITAMDEYQQMSIEELRYFDYKNGIKFSVKNNQLLQSSRLKSSINNNKKKDSHLKETVTYKTSEEEVSCPICMETLTSLKKQNLNLISSLCGHILCKPCFSKLIEPKKSKVECPHCRKSLKPPTDFHPLFI